MATAAELLARARQALAAGKPKRAVAAGWDAAREGYRLGDAAVLDEVAALAADAAALLDGKPQGQAELLRVYSERCADDARSGERAPTTIERLFGNASFAGRRKTCPECAEKVQKAAKVCRFCGHRFEPEG